jgi:hypothetical protein
MRSVLITGSCPIMSRDFAATRTDAFKHMSIRRLRVSTSDPNPQI